MRLILSVHRNPISAVRFRARVTRKSHNYMKALLQRVSLRCDGNNRTEWAVSLSNVFAARKTLAKKRPLCTPRDGAPLQHRQRAISRSGIRNQHHNWSETSI